MPYRSGFTLIEMIVVIIITSLVVGLSLAGIGRVRRDVRTTQGLANLKEMTQTIHTYAAENKAELPIGSDFTGLGSDWSIVLNDYMTGAGDNYVAVGDGGVPNIPQILPIFRDPNATFPSQGYLHYSTHPVLIPDIAHITDIEVRWRRYKLAWIQRPAEVILIMDGVQNPDFVAPAVAFSTFATARQIGNQLLAPSAADRFPSHIFYDPGDADNDGLINPDPNNYDAINVDTGANAGNIRWRQYGDTAAKFAFPDGHTETIGIGELLNRNIRADRY